jgi:hypothetical protein
MYKNWYMFCVLCRLAPIRVGVELVSRNKQKTKSASCWSYCAELHVVYISVTDTVEVELM